jgi:DNA-binding CsgD family transcriptional regulator
LAAASFDADKNGMVDQRAAPTRTALSARVVGRNAEIVQLRRALDAAIGGSGSMVFIVGEAGIGKSRLAAEAATDAGGRGLPVLRGRAVPTSTPVPYRPLAEALCSAVRGGLATADALGPYRRTLGRLVPEWQTDSPLPVDDSVVALAESVLRFLRVAGGGRGCVVVLEDLHWSDPDTVRVVEYLADNLLNEAVLCVVTLRDEQPSPALRVAHDLGARRVSPMLRLPRLGTGEVAELVQSCLRATAVEGDVLDFAGRAGGVPFLVEEVLAAGVGCGALVPDGETWTMVDIAGAVVPDTFADDMRRRLAGLGADVRAVVMAAAVLGRRFEWTLLPAITDRDEAQVLAALRRAVDAQILTIDAAEPTFRFRHALSRDAVLDDLLPPEAAMLSSRALAALEEARPELDDEWRELAAALAEGAGEGRRAARLRLEAGRCALAAGALGSAEATLERARMHADEATVAEVDDCLVEVLSLAGKWDRAREVGEALLGRVSDDEVGDRQRAELHLRLARTAVSATRWDEAQQLVESARNHLTNVSDEALAAALDAVEAQAAITRDPSRALALAEAALASATRIGLADTACDALEILGRSGRQHDLDAAEALFSQALSTAEASGLELWRTRALHELGTIDMLRGRTVARLEEARKLAVVQGALATAAVVDVQIAAAIVFWDDPGPAAVATQRCVELGRRYGLHETTAAALGLEAYVHARARRPDQLRRCADEARAIAPGAATEVKIMSASAVLALVEEDREAARRHLEVAARHAASAPGDHAYSPAGGLLALVQALDGTYHRSKADVPQASIHFLAAAFHRYASAVVAGRAGDDRAAALVTEGDQILGGHEWLRQLGRRLIAEAAVADGWGDPAAWLREALAYFDGRGEEANASACRSLLRRAGVAVPRRRGDETVPPDLRALGVTSRELEVLRLLAGGASNKDIAARLYLSPRTVERHVANLSAKTVAASRSALVAFAARTLRTGEDG